MLGAKMTKVSLRIRLSWSKFIFTVPMMFVDPSLLDRKIKPNGLTRGVPAEMDLLQHRARVCHVVLMAYVKLSDCECDE
jgi:hypothetical protein